MTSAETMREITRKHLIENNGVIIGQCLSAVGWVGGTVPEMSGHPNLIELSMDDTSGCGIAVGYALAGRRPIFICRYQGFMWYNAADFINYAAKAKEMWDYKVPIFIRSIANEIGAGPVAGGSHHGMITRMPGIPVCAPMTPKEYLSTWDYFTAHNEPIYVSECKKGFPINYEMPDIVHSKADITLFPISSARLNALEAVEMLEKDGIICNVVHLLWLKPAIVDDRILDPLENSKLGGIVIDTDYENGVSKCIAFDIMQKTNKPMRVLGLEERTAGFAAHLDNPPPSAEKICKKVENIVKNR